MAAWHPFNISPRMPGKMDELGTGKVPRLSPQRCPQCRGTGPRALDGGECPQADESSCDVLPGWWPGVFQVPNGTGRAIPALLEGENKKAQPRGLGQEKK